MDEINLKLWITLKKNRVINNESYIKEFKKIKKLLNEKELIDEELMNIIDNNIKKLQTNILKDEESIRENFNDLTLLKNNKVEELINKIIE